MMSGASRYPSFVFPLFLVLVLGLASCNVDDTNGPVDTYPYPEGHVTFQYPLIDLEQVNFYEPMGVLDVFPKDHGGFFHKQLGQPTGTLPIYALADGQIIHVGQSGNDYYMSVKYSTTISTRLGHVGQIASWVLDKIDGLGLGEQKNIFVPVEAGDTIAYVCGCSALDLGVHDQSLELNYLYPELAGFEGRYAANPLNYYDEPLRSQFAEKIFRTGEPKGGKVDYDVKGKLIGNWYLKEKHDHFFANHFAIAYDHVFTSRICFADGYLFYAEQSIAKGGQFWVKGNTPKPEEVGVGIRVKYEGMSAAGRWRYVNGEIKLIDITNVDIERPVVHTWLLEMTREEELKVEVFEGKTGDQVTDFTVNARTYLRKPEWNPFE